MSAALCEQTKDVSQVYIDTFQAAKIPGGYLIHLGNVVPNFTMEQNAVVLRSSMFIPDEVGMKLFETLKILIVPKEEPIETIPVDASPIDASPIDAAPVKMYPVDVAPLSDAPVAEETFSDEEVFTPEVAPQPLLPVRPAR